MKLQSVIDKQRQLIRTFAEGRVTFDDVKEHQDRLLADPDFDASFDQLIDTTTVSKFEISADEARVLAPVASSPSIRVELSLRLSRMFSVWRA